MVRIRFATKDDIDDIIGFLRENWSGNNVLAKSRRLFEFQYVLDDTCHFVIAADDETGKIYGIKGYIPFNSGKNPDIAAALAIVLQGIRPMLGMEIERFLETETHSRWVCATGLNQNTSFKIYQVFKKAYMVDTLKHYYRLSDRGQYRIAVVKNKRILPVETVNGEFVHIDTEGMLKSLFDLESYREQKPFKDYGYLSRRYFNHPLYRYDVIGIRRSGSGQVSALLIGREVACNGAKAYRIVDYIGDRAAIAGVGGSLDGFLAERDYEYLDFYCYGLSHEHLTQAGLTLRDQKDPNVIPNYFEPFVQQNIDIHFFATDAEDAAVFKADGDQDRPSILPEEWYG